MSTLTPSDGFHVPQEPARLLAAILEKSDDAIIHADLDGVITGWSAGAARLYGYSAEETIGSSLGLLIPDEKWGEFTTMLDRARWGVSVDRHETVRRAKNGRLLDVWFTVCPLTDDRGRVVSALSIGRDVTVLKRAESAQQASEARWRAIVESAGDGIMLISAQGTIEAFNPAAEKLFGYAVAEILGRNVNVLMPPPYRYEHDQYLANYMAGGPAKMIGIGREVTARRRNGEDFPARLSVGEMSVDGETRFTGIVHDLTERVQMEQRLREQAALATLGEMAAVVAHEVRNALATVRGAVQVIGARVPPDSREALVVPDVVGRIGCAERYREGYVAVRAPAAAATEPGFCFANIADGQK
jgi:two-component system sensor kinase FixL